MDSRAARVLIADDDPFTRDILCRFLSEKGFEIDTAMDGKRALESIEKFAPDIVLLDIRMPVMDGVECLRRIRAGACDCGVIMISGVSDSELARETLTMGAADFILKPFDLSYLEASVLAKLLAMGRPHGHSGAGR